MAPSSFGIVLYVGCCVTGDTQPLYLSEQNTALASRMKGTWQVRGSLLRLEVIYLGRGFSENSVLIILCHVGLKQGIIGKIMSGIHPRVILSGIWMVL